MSEIRIEVDDMVYSFAVDRVTARATVAQLVILSDEHRSQPAQSTPLDERDAEIERLRDELSICDRQIERLTAELAAARAAQPMPVPVPVAPHPPAERYYYPWWPYWTTPADTTIRITYETKAP